MGHHYCTHFDHRYLPRGLAMIRSLRRYEADATIWVLCLDDAALRVFEQLAEPGVRTTSLSVFEAGDLELVAAKADGRSLIEYYFSAKPSLIAHVLRAAPDADMVTYLDADLWFFADPEPIFAEYPDASVILTPHHFAPGETNLAQCGHFNAGWLSFRRSPEGLACLAWWRERCLEWCFDRVDEAGRRYADQRYLDEFANRFANVHALRHRGANLAPWNVGGHRLGMRNDRVFVDEHDPLLFFHVHGIRAVGKTLYITPREYYRSDHDKFSQERIYRPYVEALRTIARELAPFMPTSRMIDGISRGRAGGLAARLKLPLQILRAAAKGTLIRVAD